VCAVDCVQVDDLRREERKLRKRMKQVGNLLLGSRVLDIASVHIVVGL